MPQSESSILTPNEPPTKYFVASPDNCPRLTVSTNNASNLYKGKKLIKITNVNNTPQIDVKTPKTTFSNTDISSNTNNKFCGIPTTISNMKTQNPSRLFTINIPKNANHNVVMKSNNRAITIGGHPNNTTNVGNLTPTIVIPQKKLNQQTSVPINYGKGSININKIAKSVTVSSIDTSPNNLYNAQHIENSTLTSNTDNKILDDSTFFDIDEYLNAQIKPDTISPKNSNNLEFSSVISDITTNVSSVGQTLNHIKKCLTTENSFPVNTVTQSNISDINFGLDLDDGNYLSSNIDEMQSDELKMLWENIRNGNLDEDFPISDSSKIQGHELIPFNTLRNEWQEPVYNYQDNFSIDDLLQTPDIHPEESSLSLNGLKDSLYPSEDFFNDCAK